MPPRHRNSAPCPQVFTHVGNIRYHRLGDGSGMKAPEWQGVFRAAGEEPSGRPEGMSMRSGTDFRNGDGAP